jgi:hypothetical protein
MDKNQMAWNETVAASIIANLKKRRMDGSYAASAPQAREEVLSMIPAGATIYRCPSMTTAGMGLWEKFAERPDLMRIPVESDHRFRCKVGHPFRSKLDQSFRCKLGH